MVNNSKPSIKVRPLFIRQNWWISGMLKENFLRYYVSKVLQIGVFFGNVRDELTVEVQSVPYIARQNVPQINVRYRTELWSLVCLGVLSIKH